MSEKLKTKDIRTHVREHYGSIASNFRSGDTAGCACCGGSEASDTVTFYETSDVFNLPEDVTGLSLGCGDPVTLAELRPGEVVLDLGSGGGIDCFLAARQVGSQGSVIGVDMTPEMLEKARANQARMGLENVEFRLGEIEHLPTADESVDVILSNCVINLSPDKPQVFREAYRVLRPGGKLSVSDIVTSGPMPQAVKDSLAAWAGCVAGALDVSEYVEGLELAGFREVQVEPEAFSREVIDAALDELGDGVDLSGVPEEQVYQGVFSARITARKPT